VFFKFLVKDMPAARSPQSVHRSVALGFYKPALQPVTQQCCALWLYGGSEYGYMLRRSRCGGLSSVASSNWVTAIGEWRRLHPADRLCNNE
jgi:hypothetical protein